MLRSLNLLLIALALGGCSARVDAGPGNPGLPDHPAVSCEVTLQPETTECPAGQKLVMRCTDQVAQPASDCLASPVGDSSIWCCPDGLVAQ